MTKVSFRTNVLLKSIIGKDLITDDNIAILELVKNSFDAGSSSVDIVFNNIIRNTDESEIIIADSGVGMSEYDLINKWLNIAYSEKKRESKKFNRTLAGNKGVGRFSCDRLGEFLVIYTKQKNGDYIKLFIDWRKFEDVNDIKLNIQDIELETEVIPVEQFLEEVDKDGFEEGTILKITSLRKEWSYKKILKLKRQLEKLINPNQSFEAKPFEIIIKADELKVENEEHGFYDKILGPITNKIFEKLDFKVTNIYSEITEDGKEIVTTLKDRGKTIFTLREKNNFHLLKSIKISIYYLNPYSKGYFTKQTGIRSVDFGSISLFINGFRIPPYGDEGNDWLGIEQRKGQGYGRHLGTREIVGRIEINDSDENFKIISNRSGLVENEYFRELTRAKADVGGYGYYYKIFRRIERFVVEGIGWDSIVGDERKAQRAIIEDESWTEEREKYKEDSLTRNKRAFSVIEKIINARKADILDLKIDDEFIKELVTEQKAKVQADLESLVRQINNQELSTQQLSLFLNKINQSKRELATFSSNKNIDTEVFGSLKNDFSKLEQELQKSQEEQQRLKEEQERVEAENNRLIEEAERLEEELKLEKEKNTYLRTSSRSLSEDAKGLVHNIKITSTKISASVDNLYYKIKEGNYQEKMILKALGAIKFQSEKALKISKIITRSNFKADKNTQIVDVVLYLRQYIEIYADIYPKNELSFEIIDNKASLVKKVSVLDIAVIFDDLISNSEKANATKIQIEMFNHEEKSLTILFSDNGDGVPDKFMENKEKIFELGVTTTDGGSGIGLNSVKSGLKSMKGQIKFIGNSQKLKGACFEIKL